MKKTDLYIVNYKADQVGETVGSRGVRGLLTSFQSPSEHPVSVRLWLLSAEEQMKRKHK